MLHTITQLDKFAALQRVFLHKGMLAGSTSTHFAQLLGEGNDTDDDGDGSEGTREDEDEEVDGQEKPSIDERLKDAGPVAGPQSLSSVELAATSGMSSVHSTTTIDSNRHSEHKYPKQLDSLAQFIDEPGFPQALKEFLFTQRHPTCPVLDNIENRVHFSSKIQVFHSAVARFYSRSDLCGVGSMYQQCIQSHPLWYSHPRCDTVFVVQDEDKPGMQGMLIAWLHLLFSFIDDDNGETVPCALMSWFVPSQGHTDPDTGMWVVQPEGTRAHQPVQIIPLKSIA